MTAAPLQLSLVDKDHPQKSFKQREYPHFIKYMGSKSKIMDFVIEGINEVHNRGPICDLFAGSASLSGAIGDQTPIHSNDIQSYSGVISRAYLKSWCDPLTPSPAEFINRASDIYERNRDKLGLSISYDEVDDLDVFNSLEKQQQALIDREFDWKWHLFAKNYSGTWWTADQCLWIDAMRETAELYAKSDSYDLLLACIMYAMAYTSQGTGHYAQYRDAKTISSMKDISIYRKRSIKRYFLKKYEELHPGLPTEPPLFEHKSTALDFKECLKSFSKGTVYADPPYCFVHYSRFYHAIETLVLYDYPDIQVKGGKIVKGRYREGRHQSPFCIRTKVSGAFRDMFEGVKESDSNLVLSYSNTGMISIDELTELATNVFGSEYTLEALFTDHKHMTLGRQKDRHREVEECLILVKKK